MSATCPSCGQPIPANKQLDALIADIAAQSTASERIVLRYLYQHFGQRIATQDVVDRLYADDPDGGPETANGVVRVVHYALRKRLEPHGLTIKGYSGRKCPGETKLDWMKNTRAFTAEAA